MKQWASKVLGVQSPIASSIPRGRSPATGIQSVVPPTSSVSAEGASAAAAVGGGEQSSGKASRPRTVSGQRSPVLAHPGVGGLSASAPALSGSGLVTPPPPLTKTPRLSSGAKSPAPVGSKSLPNGVASASGAETSYLLQGPRAQVQRMIAQLYEHQQRMNDGRATESHAWYETQIERWQSETSELATEAYASLGISQEWRVMSDRLAQELRESKLECSSEARAAETSSQQAREAQSGVRRMTHELSSVKTELAAARRATQDLSEQSRQDLSRVEERCQRTLREQSDRIIQITTTEDQLRNYQLHLKAETWALQQACKEQLRGNLMELNETKQELASRDLAFRSEYQFLQLEYRAAEASAAQKAESGLPSGELTSLDTQYQQLLSNTLREHEAETKHLLTEHKTECETNVEMVRTIQVLKANEAELFTIVHAWEDRAAQFEDDTARMQQELAFERVNADRARGWTSNPTELFRQSSRLRDELRSAETTLAAERAEWAQDRAALREECIDSVGDWQAEFAGELGELRESLEEAESSEMRLREELRATRQREVANDSQSPNVATPPYARRMQLRHQLPSQAENASRPRYSSIQHLNDELDEPWMRQARQGAPVDPTRPFNAWDEEEHFNNLGSRPRAAPESRARLRGGGDQGGQSSSSSHNPGAGYGVGAHPSLGGNRWGAVGEAGSRHPPSSHDSELDSGSRAPSRPPSEAPAVAGKSSDPMVPTRKEAEKVTVPAFPTVISLPQWRTDLAHQLMSAAGKSDTSLVVQWIKKCWEPGVTSEDFYDSGGPAWETLDMKLLTAMKAMLAAASNKPQAKEVLRVLNSDMELAVDQGRACKGRHAVYLLMVAMSAHDDEDYFFGLDHLAKLSIVNNDLQEFLHRWDYVFTRLDPALQANKDMFTHMFYRIVRTHTDIRDVINKYELLENGSAGKTYSWLRASIGKRLLQLTRDRNMNDKEHLLNEANKPAKKAAAAVEQDSGGGQPSSRTPREAKRRTNPSQSPRSSLPPPLPRSTLGESLAFPSMGRQVLRVRLPLRGPGGVRGETVPPRGIASSFCKGSAIKMVVRFFMIRLSTRLRRRRSWRS